jgi:hypothetical protein
MGLDKLKLESSGGDFTVMVNPNEFHLKEEISYNDKSTEGRHLKFESYKKAGITFPKIILDTTGAIPKHLWPMDGSIKDMIEKLKNVVYTLDGESHEPPIVTITWGSFEDKARLLSMDTSYTLFDTAGDPLRAEIVLKFGHHEKYTEIEAKANKQSPDLTHIIEVKSGDTLPNLCNKVYNDPSYYMQVARINHLSSFCHIQPGTRLVFPPLVD